MKHKLTVADYPAFDEENLPPAWRWVVDFAHARMAEAFDWRLAPRGQREVPG